MKKLIYLIIFFSANTYTYSQHIEVEYNVTALQFQQIDEVKDIPEDVINSMKESLDLIKTIKMTLKASRTESYFYSNTKLANDVNSENFRMAQIMIGSDDIFYSNLSTDEIKRYFNAYGEKLVIESNVSELKWTLTKDTKQIGEYQCYKAVTNYVLKNSLGSFNKEVVAYYSPDINYRFGPNGYSGLPGLIMELQEDKFVYTIEKINFSNENLQPKKIRKAKVVTQNELLQMGQKARENRKW